MSRYDACPNCGEYHCRCSRYDLENYERDHRYRMSYEAERALEDRIAEARRKERRQEEEAEEQRIAALRRRQRTEEQRQLEEAEQQYYEQQQWPTQEYLSDPEQEPG